MAKQVIIDWQRDGLIVATGHRRGSNVVLDRVVQKQNVPGSPEVSLGQHLRDAIHELGLAKHDASVIMPRELLEARTLQIPRGDADEVPDMVRFQAQRQMANMGDNWPIDFVLLPDVTSQETITALAFTIAPGVMTEIETACLDAGLHLQHVLARPIEIARFATTLGGLSPEGVTLVISMSEGHADLLLLRDGRVVQIRATRLPHDGENLSAGLIAEVRRSLLAAASSLDGQQIVRTLLIASADLAQKVEVQVAEATNSEVRLLDPAVLLPASFERKSELAHATASRLAAVAAVVGDPSPAKETVIDLKNPKRRPPKKKNVLRYALVATSIGIVGLLGLSWWWNLHSEMDRELASLRTAGTELDEKVKIAVKQIKDEGDVENFLKASINWLDELEYVSVKIPPSEKVKLYNTSFNVSPSGNGEVKFEVLADSPDSISEMEASLRDAKHRVNSEGTSQYERPNEYYRWRAAETIVVTDSGWKPIANPKASVSLTTSAGSTPIPQAKAVEAADESKN